MTQDILPSKIAPSMLRAGATWHATVNDANFVFYGITIEGIDDRDLPVRLSLNRREVVAFARRVLEIDELARNEASELAVARSQR